MSIGAESGTVPGGPRLNRREVLLGGAAFTFGSPSLLREDLLFNEERPLLGEALVFFDALALMRGTRDGQTRPGTIRKWTKPVEVALSRRASAAERRDIATLLATLSEWTRLPFSLVDKPAGTIGVLTIERVADDSLKKQARHPGAVCMTTTFGNRGSLHTGFVAVGDSHGDCLSHELMHALGFDNHWRGTSGLQHARSVLAPRRSLTRASGFSRWDELAIRALYHPRLRPGTPREAALPIAYNVVRDLLAV